MKKGGGDTDRTILHCDLNNFFASVECRKFPELKGYPVAVCGDIENRHGIILAKNEIAKKFNVKTAEVVWEAKKKCPNLVLLPPHMDEYVDFSHKAHEIYKRYTDLIEPFGIDECWLDVTGSKLLYGGGEEIAYKIKEDIKRELELTISVGVSFNKIYAKLGSDLKKPDAVTVISRENYKEKLFSLNADEMIGVGKKTYQKLLKYGIVTLGDLAGANEKFMTRNFGKAGADMIKCASGNEPSPVCHQDFKEEIKSVGNSVTSPRDLTSADEVWHYILTLSDEVSTRLRAKNLFACGVQVSVKDNSFTVKEFQAPLAFPTRSAKEISALAMSLFTKNYDLKKPIRLVGVRTYNLVNDKQTYQCSLFGDEEKRQKQEQLEEKIFELRQKFGDNSISFATLINSPSDEKGDEKNREEKNSD